MTGKKLKKEWMKLPAECFETLTFTDLKPGDRFIALPVPGDNSGQGGFQGNHWVFQKLRGLNTDLANVVRLKDGVPSFFPSEALVLRVE